MELYINSAGIISGAGNNISGKFSVIQPDAATHHLAAEPDYKEHIPVMQLRRMSKVVRMGVVASRKAMQDAGIEQPDAISVGSAYGCLQDTERFLSKLVEQDEQMLTPTAFIQSTHNTVSGQIALLSKCNSHNLTFVQGGHSFEHAMLNAYLQLQDNVDDKVLVGGIDELTNNSIKALQAAGAVAKDEAELGNKSAAGEGATFFTVSRKPLYDKHLKINNLKTFTANTEEEVNKQVQSFINDNNLKDIDTFLTGVSPDNSYKDIYTSLHKQHLPEANFCKYKHLSGEYPVSSAFALGLLFESIAENKLPESCYIKQENNKLKNILLVNNFCDKYSCWAIELSV